MLKGVCQACCGHGKIGDAYVVLGGHPNQLPHEIRDRVELRGQFALNYFADQGCDVPPCEDEAK
jgi:hypothetical protein